MLTDTVFISIVCFCILRVKTEMEMIKYPSIEQFRHIVKNVKSLYSYLGEEYPKITFYGSVKLHGTNGGIGWDGEKLWCQSRNNILDFKNTNNGFFTYVMQNKEYFTDLLGRLKGDAESIIVFGEWCGEGIQKGVALSELEKMFVAFGIKLKVDGAWVWSNTDISTIKNHDRKVYNTNDFERFEVVVDIASPQEAQEEIVNLVDRVENECPVGKFFGVSGIGEGIVFSCTHRDRFYQFKAKGQKHSTTKVKKISSPDIEKMKEVKDFVNYAVTENRVIQAIYEVEAKDRKDTGKLIKWVVSDVIKEESDTLVENGLEIKDMTSCISNKVRSIFFAKLDSEF